MSLHNDEAVLDKETQLVWERTAGDTDGDEDVDDDDDLSWIEARTHCAEKEVGGRKGWKLASFDQLASLVDINSAGCTLVAGSSCLPDDHPFIGVPLFSYWSATTDAEAPIRAWRVSFFNGNVSVNNKGVEHFVWCVRSGQSGPSVY